MYTYLAQIAINICFNIYQRKFKIVIMIVTNTSAPKMPHYVEALCISSLPYWDIAFSKIIMIKHCLIPLLDILAPCLPVD